LNKSLQQGVKLSANGSTLLGLALWHPAWNTVLSGVSFPIWKGARTRVIT